MVMEESLVNTPKSDFSVKMAKTGKSIESINASVRYRQTLLVKRFMSYRDSPYFKDFEFWKQITSVFDLSEFPVQKEGLKKYRSTRLFVHPCNAARFCI